MLQAVAGIALGALVTNALGCAQSDPGLPVGTATACGADHCLDLADVTNGDLVVVGGALVVMTADDTIMVVRTSETTVIALSAICTHAGCTMNYDAMGRQVTCPCHGSLFGEDGLVVRGPATRPVKTYAASITNEVITLVG